MKLQHLFESQVDINSITKHTVITINENTEGIIPMLLTLNRAVSFKCSFNTETLAKLERSNSGLTFRFNQFRKTMVQAINSIGSYEYQSEDQDDALDKYETELASDLTDLINILKAELPYKTVYGNKSHAAVMHQLRSTIHSQLEKQTVALNQVYANGPVKIYMAADDSGLHIGLKELLQSLDVAKHPAMEHWIKAVDAMTLECSQVAVVECESEYMLIFDRMDYSDDTIAFAASTTGTRIFKVLWPHTDTVLLGFGPVFKRNTDILAEGIMEVLTKHMEVRVKPSLNIHFG